MDEGCLNANKQHKFGKHKYSLEQFGLDQQIVSETFADYTDSYLKSRPIRTCAQAEYQRVVAGVIWAMDFHQPKVPIFVGVEAVNLIPDFEPG